MEILVAEHSGFCEGVERAFRIALETAREGKPVFMLGNLVHNRQVVERLENFGVKTVASMNEIPASTHGLLLISAHGVAPGVYEAARQRGFEIVDTSCPWVKKPQKLAKELADEGRLVIIFGDKKHPEVKGVVGWAGERALVVENEADLEKLSLSPETKVGIMAQTTQVEDDFQRLVALVKQKVRDVKEYDTICGATSKRQSAAVALAKKVALMLVIGDRMSANTKRLFELCSRTGTETHQIQTKDELVDGWLIGKEKIGITAGASTPDWVINEVISLLRAHAEPAKNNKG